MKSEVEAIRSLKDSQIAWLHSQNSKLKDQVKSSEDFAEEQEEEIENLRTEINLLKA